MQITSKDRGFKLTASAKVVSGHGSQLTANEPTPDDLMMMMMVMMMMMMMVMVMMMMTATHTNQNCQTTTRQQRQRPASDAVFTLG